MSKLEEIKPGVSIVGIKSQGLVKILSVEWHGNEYVTITYKEESGQVNQQTIGRDKENQLKIFSQENAWTFDADSELFRLASEARRIKLAYLFDPLLAIHTSKIRPLPHQITAVYDNMLHRQPLHFLLADDPGAGKTIMAGLLIKELMVREDVKRCLIVVPGGLVEQWQDELFEKFHLEFEIVSRDRIENSRTGNPFSELDLVLARLDQLSRFEDLKEKVCAKDWDLIIVDEAHKMAAHFYGNKLEATKRYQLGEKLREHTRHLLLMTATPHNGKNEDFQLFMALLDKDRFEGRPRGEGDVINASDMMRRMDKESILTFEEKKLFPERFAYSKDFQLSPEEGLLYKHVTEYVREEFNRAELKGEKKKNVVGFALTILQRRLASSPEAIYQSIKRRKEKLQKRLHELYQIREGKIEEKKDSFYEFSQEDIEDFEDNPNIESEEMEERLVDQATASETIPEFEKEIATLEKLEKDALALRNSQKDSKWGALRDLLENNKEMFDAKGFRRKLIIFTEHRNTLTYLENRIRKLIGKPEAVIVIHGGVKRGQRKYAQDKFTQDENVSILVATDAAGEGINLQRANLMINYDLPWNPNRIEQRFGRIHRINQTEVCFLWNLFASETREGDVWATLFNKLEEQQKALGGRVFDVLGKVFREKSLKELLLESVRYGEDPKRKIELQREVKGVLDIENIRKVMKENAIGETSLSLSDIQAIREDMERANARKLQPHFIASFFIKAFTQFGGTISEKEKNRFEIRYVPAIIRQKDKLKANKIQTKYERVCFDKELANLEGKPIAEFLCPGHALFDSTLELVLEKYAGLLRQGSVLIDTSGKLSEPALLYYLEHEIDDERELSGGQHQVVSKQMQFIYLTKSNQILSAGYAPYLDCRPLKQNEKMGDVLMQAWIKNNPEKTVVDFALANIVPNELSKIQLRRNEIVEKTIKAVQDRLTKEINYWDNRANELKQKELEGRAPAGLNSGMARQKADEMHQRMKRRLSELEKERRLINKPPFIVGGALIVPETMIGTQIPDFATNPENRKKTEFLAIQAVIEAEKKLGRLPQNVMKENKGWDIESMNPTNKKIYFIEVKGREEGATVITVSRNEILAGANICEDDSQRYILAIVEVKNGKANNPKYVRNPPFDKHIQFEVTSQNYDLKKLLTKAEEPQ
ncbi:MAG: helicase-related protein [Candidatus Diapherotrites archaeon]